MFIKLKMKLSTLLHSEEFKHLNDRIVQSFELALVESEHWLRENNYFFFLGESEINKGNQNGEQSYRYGISFIFFGTVVDDFKTNFVGCSMCFFLKGNILTLTITTYSIYEEIDQFRININDYQNFDLKSVSNQIENEVRKISKHTIDCLHKYFTSIPEEIMKKVIK